MRIGIIGTNFVSGWTVNACRRLGEVDPVAVHSRSAETGAEFAREHDIERVFTDRDEFLAHDLDAVYIASPMKLHAEQTIAALEAGKHVLCEKTLGVNLAEFEAIVAAAERNDRVVVEEVRPMFDPAWDRIAERLSALGTIRRAAFELCQYSSRYDDFRRGEVLNAFNPELANAALLDIGVYCLHPALKLFGEPQRVQTSSVRLANGFDGAGAILLDYAQHYVELSYSKISSSVRPSVIEGEDASMLIDSMISPTSVSIEYRDGRSEIVLAEESTGPDHKFEHAVAGFAALVRAGDVHHERLEVSRWAMQVIDQAGVTKIV
ncbi:Gfo/Idh/MocA family protein [Enemella sp. A6]|uniref:Gfo/Idh/MocA family protein n=1 Tax=Enemella sp. A6 TaxID=3440152 RepID=UPI003EBC533C